MKKNNALSVLFAFVMTLTIFAVSAAAMEGDGTPESPLQISTEEDLLEFAGRVEGNGDIQDAETDLYADLTADLTIDDWPVIGRNTLASPNSTVVADSGTPYAGVFNGNGHKLTLKRIQQDASANAINNIAFFHTIEASGVVKNLNLDVYFEGKKNIAGVAVRNYGTIERVTVVEGSIIKGTSTDIGGIVLYNGKALAAADANVPPAKILHCFNKADVSGVHNVAGIACYFLGEMSFCGNEGTITGSW